MNSVPIIVEASLNDHFRSLKREQNSAFQDIKQRILSNSAEPLCLLGSGGTGKSFVACILVDLINLQYNNSNIPSISKNVIVSAPTGVAAKNIGGVTCNSAFSLPIEKFKVGEYLKIKEW